MIVCLASGRERFREALLAPDYLSYPEANRVPM